MMRSTFGGLEVSKRALFAMQTAQQTTAHNIANANTKGYTRQVVNLVASRPLEAVGLQRSTNAGQIGQGVEFDSINRIREKFLDDQFYNENKSQGEWSIRRDTLEKLESIVNEPSDTGLRQTIEGFWNSWQELTKAPDNVTARILVKERALALTEAFNYTARKLDDLSSDLTENIRVKATQADSILRQVASLNNEIFRVEGLSNNANDLRDQRDLLVDELSGIMNISVTEDNSGYIVRMGTTESVNGINKNVTVDSAFLEGQFNTGLTSGEVYGMMVSRDQHVTSYQDKLNQMALAITEGEVEVTLPEGTMLPTGVTVTGTDGTNYTGTLTADTKVIVNGINGLHQLGYSLEDVPGEAFFTITTGSEALGLSVNANIVNNVSLIAASNRTYVDANGDTKVVKGNNDLALLIAGLKDKDFEFEGSAETGTIDEFYRSIIGQLGVESQEASRQAINQKVLVDQVDSRRQAVSGVSLDEEMANMIKYQHSYNAAARVMTTFDEMLNKVINGMGVVGR
jgi:flagellar hook-associated protein 1 FlgK